MGPLLWAMIRDTSCCCYDTAARTYHIVPALSLFFLELVDVVEQSEMFARQLSAKLQDQKLREDLDPMGGAVGSAGCALLAMSAVAHPCTSVPQKQPRIPRRFASQERL